MAKLYSSFIRSMIKASENFNGKVRNIIGDCIMVIFDSEDCFTEAVETAFLMNTISSKIINKHFKNNEFSCGIGIDYGDMMVTKCGTIKYGDENSSYKSLVWLGKPANIASKLTDEANKPSTYTNISENGVNVGIHYKYTDKWIWKFQTIEEFKENIECAYITPMMRYKDENFSCFYATSKTDKVCNNDATPPILVTESVYLEYKKANPSSNSIIDNLWKKQSRKISNYSGIVYGCNVVYKW